MAATSKGNFAPRLLRGFAGSQLTARGMIVLKLDGWDSSYGVGKEIEFCRRHDMQVEYLDPVNLLVGIRELRKRGLG